MIIYKTNKYIKFMNLTNVQNVLKILNNPIIIFINILDYQYFSTIINPKIIVKFVCL